MVGPSAAPLGRLVALALVIGLGGCAPPADTAPAATIGFSGPPRALDDIDCESLVATPELERLFDQPAVALGRFSSSCHWLVGDVNVQLVLQTGSTVEGWRSRLLETYTRFVDAGIDAWGEPGGPSIAAFGPDRGLIVHGVADPGRAVALLRIALPRL